MIEFIHLSCPHCKHEPDTDELLRYGLYDGEDGGHDVNCEKCKKDYVISSSWNPTFEAMTEQEYEEQ